MAQNGFLKKSVLVSALIVAAFAFTLFTALQANAQTTQSSGPQFLITWRAQSSFVPLFYAGKALPNAQSQIAASLTLISNGQPVDLSSQTIYWYLNDTLLGGGVGTQHITFSPFGGSFGTLTLRVELPDYASGILIHEITIPVVRPIAVIYAPHPNDKFSDSQITVNALPYFFSASPSALSFRWSVNDATGTSQENPDVLHINLPNGTPSNFTTAVSLTIQNPNDSTIAVASKNLTYQK